MMSRQRSPACSRRGCGRKCSHLSGPRVEKDLSARFQGYTGRGHVVDQNDDTPFDPFLEPRASPASQGERALNIVTSLGRRQRRLGERRAGPSQHVLDRRTETTGKRRGLVETARPVARRMEGNRHHEVGSGQHLFASGAHQCRQRAGQRLTVLVLVRVDDGAERAIVDAGRAAAGDARPWVTSHAAGGLWPRCQRGPAASTQWRRQPREVTPAGIAHDAAGRMAEQAVAGSTARGPGEGEYPVQYPVQGAPGPRRGRHATWLTTGLTTLPSSGGTRELDARGTAPEAVKVVEAAGLLGKDVNDEVKAVDEDPFAMVVALHVGWSSVSLPQLFEDSIDDSPYLTSGLTRTDHEVVCKRA